VCHIWKTGPSGTSGVLMVDRNTIIDNLVDIFEDKRYYLLVCDCGFAKIDMLMKQYPNRVINCGIMEQATVGIAAGMAQAGLKPIIYSIASFIAFKGLEQIRNDVVLMNRNVKIIGNGVGDFFKGLGDCHCVYEDDIAVMNAIKMPVYNGKEFDIWINSLKPGYIRV